MTLTNGTTLNVDLEKLATFANGDTTSPGNGDTNYGGSGTYTARHHLTQMSGSLGQNALFVGVAFAAPSELTGATQVKVTLNGTALTTDGSNEIFGLEDDVVSGTGSDTLDNVFIQYLPFALAGANDGSSNTAENMKIADGSYSFVFTWLDADGAVLGTSTCTINRVSA